LKPLHPKKERKQNSQPPKYIIDWPAVFKTEVGGELLPDEDVVFSAYRDIAPISDDYKEND
jgi:hypothetical protein